MLLVGQLCLERGLKLERAAEAHALAGITLADAFTSCWNEKYETDLLRPVSYIRAHVPVGSRGCRSSTRDSSRVHLGALAGLTGYRVRVDRAAGRLPYTDRTHQLRNPDLGSRSFASLQAAVDEAAHSRLLGGIHYPMGIEVGLSTYRISSKSRTK